MIGKTLYMYALCVTRNIRLLISSIFFLFIVVQSRTHIINTTTHWVGCVSNNPRHVAAVLQQSKTFMVNIIGREMDFECHTNDISFKLWQLSGETKMGKVLVIWIKCHAFDRNKNKISNFYAGKKIGGIIFSLDIIEMSWPQKVVSEMNELYRSIGCSVTPLDAVLHDYVITASDLVATHSSCEHDLDTLKNTAFHRRIQFQVTHKNVNKASTLQIPSRCHSIAQWFYSISKRRRTSYVILYMGCTIYVGITLCSISLDNNFFSFISHTTKN